MNYLSLLERGHSADTGDTALTASLLSGAVLAAVIGAIVSVSLAAYRSYLEDRARVRDQLASAMRSVNDYKELPYAIRRRRADEPGAERIRLSESMRATQSQLSYFEAWTGAESKRLGQQYGTLVKTLRSVAGAACRDAWLSAAPKKDSDMNIAPDLVDLREVTNAERLFATEINRHLRWMWLPWKRR
jgi:hypothetical protein